VTDAPQPGDFAVTSVVGPVGFLISLGERLNGSRFGHWDHAFVYVGDGQLVEAEPGGARLAGLDEYQGRPVLWSTGHVELTDEQRQAIVGAARAVIGTPYSALDYLSIALAHFHVRPSWLKRYIASNKHMICSQTVDYCYQQAGVHLFDDGRIPGDVTPADLASLIGA
jgi:uncharacterized protein YycO